MTDKIWSIDPFYMDGCVSISQPGSGNVLVRPYCGLPFTDARKIAQSIVDTMNAALASTKAGA